MSKMLRIAGIIICVLLAIGLALLSLFADETMYMVYLIAASVLGVMAGLFKNIGT